MSLENISEVKKDKGFKKRDIIIYGIIAVLAAVLFIVVFVIKDSTPLSGIRIYVDNVAVFEYSFQSDEYNVAKDAEGVTVSEDGGIISVKVDAFGGYNIVEINKTALSVKVTEADCGKGDCVYTKAITDNSGIIYCSPHRLRVEPFYFDGGDGFILF